MKAPPHVVEIFLQPGEFYFGDCNNRIRTLLGSCVAITMWHPVLLVGGMCHYLLPERPSGKQELLDGRYADEALELLCQEARRLGTQPHEYHAKLFGGGQMFGAMRTWGKQSIGSKNVAAGRMQIKRHGLTHSGEHWGGLGHRNVIFDIWSGHVWMRHHVAGNPAGNNDRTGE